MVVGAAKVAAVAPLIFVHGPVAEVLLCHWILQVPVPPLTVLLSVAVPPTQTVLFEGVMLIVGAGVTVTVARLEVTAPQPLPAALTTTW